MKREKIKELLYEFQFNINFAVRCEFYNDEERTERCNEIVDYYIDEIIKYIDKPLEELNKYIENKEYNYLNGELIAFANDIQTLIKLKINNI